MGDIQEASPLAWLAGLERFASAWTSHSHSPVSHLENGGDNIGKVVLPGGPGVA